jgi:arylsulfatase A-like enzyme
LKRRDFLKYGSAITASAMAGGLTSNRAIAEEASEPVPGKQPNILYILVDELRYPTVFPMGVNNADEFIAKFMPRVHKLLWSEGVKFSSHYTAGNACTPARGVLISGLYTHQSWLVQTILSKPTTRVAIQPVLNRAYPTYGKLLRQAGYQTPYIGKWHVSIVEQNVPRLALYGFDGMTFPDNTGSNLQGTYGDEMHGYHNDEFVANQAINWLGSKAPVMDEPWCLTVSFVNPHDKEFFPAGTEFTRFTNLFAANPQFTQIVTYPGDGPQVPDSVDKLKDPNSYAFPAIPDNWESTDHIMKEDKPSTQILTRLFSAGVWGGVSEDPSQDDFTVVPYPTNAGYGVGLAPYSYWKRNLDIYAQIMTIVDEEIGDVIDALNELPKDIVENTVIVFTSDHGEYAGAHGYVSGKVGSCYEEAWHVPLIVVDPSHRFVQRRDIIRNKLTSSVDMLTLLVSLGNKGSRDWISGDLIDLYGQRHDMIAMLRSAKAPGRPYVLFATDEVAPGFYNFNNAPGHIIGYRTEETKLGVYAKWFFGTAQIDPSTVQLEFYDYNTASGRLELENVRASEDPRVMQMYSTLLNDVIPNELEAPLPLPLRIPQAISLGQYLIYDTIISNLGAAQFKAGALRDLIGYGAEF